MLMPKPPCPATASISAPISASEELAHMIHIIELGHAGITCCFCVQSIKWMEAGGKEEKHRKGGYYNLIEATTCVLVFWHMHCSGTSAAGHSSCVHILSFGEPRHFARMLNFSYRIFAQT